MNLDKWKKENKAVALIAVAISALSLTACTSHDMSDLEKFTADIKSRKSGHIEPLPEIKPYESYTYKSSDLRDPFVSTFEIQETTTDTDTGNGIHPDRNRRKEALESYPLDTLRMVGILNQRDMTWAVIKAQDGTIHRVQTGNYMGQNHGRITSISEEKIELIEIVPNSRGGWEERPAKLAMSEES
jgi:type IV pilus assembly protein PilP